MKPVLTPDLVDPHQRQGCARCNDRESMARE